MAIKIAQVSDKVGVINLLTLAFSTDPMARWSLPNPAKYLTTFSSIAQAFGGIAFEKGTAYLANDFAGAALWLSPGARSDEESLKKLSMRILTTV